MLAAAALSRLLAVRPLLLPPRYSRSLVDSGITEKFISGWGKGGQSTW